MYTKTQEYLGALLI